MRNRIVEDTVDVKLEPLTFICLNFEDQPVRCTVTEKIAGAFGGSWLSCHVGVHVRSHLVATR